MCKIMMVFPFISLFQTYISKDLCLCYIILNSLVLFTGFKRKLQPWIAKDDEKSKNMENQQYIVKVMVELMCNYDKSESLVILASV